VEFNKVKDLVVLENRNKKRNYYVGYSYKYVLKAGICLIDACLYLILMKKHKHTL